MSTGDFTAMEMTRTQMTGQLTTGAIWALDDRPWWQVSPYQPAYQCTPYVVYATPGTAPLECSGDVHVFPCPHCEKCKCGAATVKRAKAKK